MNAILPDLLTADQTAEYLKLKPQSLALWRMLRQGPPFVKIGRSVRYRSTDLERYLAAATVTAAVVE